MTTVYSQPEDDVRLVCLRVSEQPGNGLDGLFCRLCTHRGLDDRFALENEHVTFVPVLLTGRL